MLGLYLYATGAQHQLISILTNLGLCSSYVSIAGGMQSPLVDNGAPPAAPPPDKQVDESEDKDENEDNPNWLPDQDGSSNLDWETDEELEPEESDIEGEQPELIVEANMVDLPAGDEPTEKVSG